MANDTVLVEKATTNGAAAGNGTIPLNTIEPFTEDLIAAALDGWENCTRKPDGSFSAVTRSTTIPAALHCSFRIDNLKVFTLSCHVSPTIPNRKRAEVLRLCHEYHATQPYGRFFLRPGNADETQYTLCFDAHLDAWDGISLAFLRSYLITHLAGACGFLVQPAIVKLLSPSASPQKRSKTTNNKETT